MNITTSETVGKSATDVPGTTGEFQELSIEYCCGGNRTLAEACAQANNVHAVLARLEPCAKSPSLIGDRIWGNQSLADLMAHINRTQHVFVRTECARIKALITKVVAALSYRRLLEALHESEVDLHQHIHLENNVLFRRAKARQADAGVGTSASVLSEVRCSVFRNLAIVAGLRFLLHWTKFVAAQRFMPLPVIVRRFHA